jgi:hypothetical protein
MKACLLGSLNFALSTKTRRTGTSQLLQEGVEMSFIDVLIPAIIGSIALAWPTVVFYGSRATPDAKKIRLIRGAGALLLVVSALYLAIKLAGG